MSCDIKQEYISDTKREVMQICDESFEHSICARANFEELFNKIDKFAEFIVAYDEEALGYVAMYANDKKGKVAYITLIGVRPQYRGKHVGKRLLMECCKIALSQGMKEIKLEVRNKNEKAMTFYEKNGFKVISSASERSVYMSRALG